MPIKLPGRHSAYEPIGALRTNPFHAGKKGMMMPLNLTAMVDMFTTIVIFLLQSFSASGDLMFIQKDLVLPNATQAIPLEEQGPVVTLFHNEVLISGEKLVSLEELDDTEPGIPMLQERLTKIREREEAIKNKYGTADPTKPYDGHMIVQADAATDFELVRRTIFAMNMAGWIHIQFAVLNDAPQPAAPVEEG